MSGGSGLRAAIALALGLAASTPLAAAAAPEGTAHAAIPATLQLGTLRLQSCNVGDRSGDGLATVSAYCGTLAVPEDWSGPGGRQIRLRIAVVGAAAAAPESDLVTFLDGGPGGAASDDYPAIAPALAALQSRRRILLVDQRGTGGSNGLKCAAPSASTITVATPAAWVQQCLREVRTHAAPQFYTTTAAALDLEAVRQALGAPQLDLIAISYGTRLAQQYAARYPAAVRSVVLDSPVPNSLALLSDHARNLEHTLRALFDRCREQAPCAQRFGDPYATLYRVRARLQAQARAVDLRDPVSFEPLHLTLGAEDLAALVRFYAYSPITAALLPLMLQQAERGDYATLLGQKQWLAQDLSDQITGALELSVLCAEDADLLSVRPEDENTLLGNDAIRRAQASCTLWPKGSRPADFHRPWTSSLPALVLSGELDPVTPPDYGRQIVRHLARARLLIAPGQGHGVLSVGCMPRLVERFVVTLQPPALDEGCLSRLGDTPAFVDYNGPGP